MAFVSFLNLSFQRMAIYMLMRLMDIVSLMMVNLYGNLVMVLKEFISIKSQEIS